VNTPDPDKWFRAKIEIGKNTVKVYVDDSEKAILKIERLEELRSDKIGIWTGFNSSGTFRNLQLETR